MRLPKARLAGVGISVAVVAAVAGVTLGVTTLLGVTFQGSGEAQESLGFQRVEGALLTANRDRLAICVEAVGVDSSLEATAKSGIETALTEVAKHPDWEASGLATAELVIDSGCPSQPPPPDLPDYPKAIEVTFGHIVSEPSRYKLFVFILPRQELDAFLGGSTIRVAPQESMCEGDVCWEVTAALYLAADEISVTPLTPFLIGELVTGVALDSDRFKE